VFVPVAPVFNIYQQFWQFPRKDQQMRPSQTSFLIPQVYIALPPDNGSSVKLFSIMLPSGLLATDLALLHSRKNIYFHNCLFF
jgi:hypothetical protein